MRRIRDQHLLARVAAARQIGANQQQAGQFALRAGGGLQRGGVHAGDFEQALLQRRQDFQAALREFLRLIGMLGGDAVQPRDEFVHARVVLHGAGAQRIHAQIDGVVPGGEPREVADHFDLADFGKALDAVAQRSRRRAASCASTGGHVERRQLHAALAGRGLLEDQPFVLADVASRFFDSVGQVSAPPLELASARIASHGGRQPLDLLARRRLRDADQAALGEFRIERPERQRPDDLLAQQVRR